MKFLAILRDSLRETRDSFVFYFLLGLSALVILAVASIGFQPEPAVQGVQAIVERFPGQQMSAFIPVEPPLRYAVEDFEQTNAAARPWEGAYRFRLVVRESKDTPYTFRMLVYLSGLESAKERARLQQLAFEAATQPPERQQKFFEEKLGEQMQKITPANLEDFVRKQLAAWGDMEADQVRLESEKGREVRFAVAMHAKREAFRTWPQKATILFGALSFGENWAVGQLMYTIEDLVVGTYGAGIAMLLSTIITAFFIPNMLRKGTVDLLIAKPIHRTTLLVYKYIGGLLFMVLNTVVVIVGIWLVLGLRSGLWMPGFLAAIPIFTAEFAIFYAVSALFAVLTRSPIVAILMGCVAWVLLVIVGLGHRFVESTREADIMPKWLVATADGAHLVLPRYKDLDSALSYVLARELLTPEYPERKQVEKQFDAIGWPSTIGGTAAFIAVLLGLACWRFATKDY
jgi:ABC-type transport system involved in multi-copper enzyme maturation permease subunit